MLQTYTLSVPVIGADGLPIAGAMVTAKLTKVDFTLDNTILPKIVTGTTDDDGVCELALVSNLIGTTDSRYLITIRSPGGALIDTATIQMPEADSSLQQLVDRVPITPEYSTAAAISAAIATSKAAQAAESEQRTAEDREATAADRVATGQDRQAVANDRQETSKARDDAQSAARRARLYYYLGA